MANLYKKPIFVTDVKTGRKVKAKSRKWWGRYRDENGLEKRVPLVADKPAAQSMLHELVRKAERRRAGMEDPFEEHRKRPLLDHLGDFKAYLANKESSGDYVQTTAQRVQSVL